MLKNQLRYEKILLNSKLTENTIKNRKLKLLKYFKKYDDDSNRFKKRHISLIDDELE